MVCFYFSLVQKTNLTTRRSDLHLARYIQAAVEEYLVFRSEPHEEFLWPFDQRPLTSKFFEAQNGPYFHRHGSFLLNPSHNRGLSSVGDGKAGINLIIEKMVRLHVVAGLISL